MLKLSFPRNGSKLAPGLGLAIAIFSLAGTPLGAQEVTANIVGAVTDSSGAAVLDAAITVTNTGRGTSRTFTTNEAGLYVAPLLPPGAYSVSAELRGFKKATRSGIELNVNAKVTVDFKLEVGDVAVEVSVVADPTQVELQTAQQSGLISGAMVRGLSLNNRHFAQLLSLQPGVVSNTSDAMYVGTTNPSGGNNLVAFSVNGQRQSANNWMVDGADNLDRGSNLTILNYPSVDAIEEVKVVRSAYSSEFGRSAGGQVNVVTRGGTNIYHGTAYEFFRNDKLNANNFFNNANRVNLGADGKAQRPILRQNSFGYNFGGPVRLPGYNGRNKTFFFFNEEWRKTRTAIANEVLVPNAAEKAGNFSADICTGPLADPCSQVGRAIPAGQINPASRQYIQDIFSKIPDPSIAGTNRLFVPLAGIFDGRQEILRVDHTVNPKLQVFGRLILDAIPTVEPGGLFTNVFLPNVAITKTNSPGRSYVGRATQTMRSNLTAEWGYSFSRGAIVSEPLGLIGAKNSPNIKINLPFATTLGRIPSLVLGGLTPITGFGPYNNFSYNHNLLNNTNWVKGRHSVKMGFQYNFYRKQENAAGANAGSFTFANTPRPATLSAANAYMQSWANFLLGNVATFSQASLDLTPNIRSRGFELYVQDDYRLASNFTLNVGLRYSNFRQPYADGQTLSNFDRSLYSAANAPQIDPNTGNLVANTGNRLNGISIAGTTSPYGTKVGREQSLDLAPRVGFAWDPWRNGKTSIRSGYGIFYDTALVGILQQNVFANPPLVQSITISGTKLDNPTAGAPVVSLAPLALRGTPVDLQTPYSQQWSLDVQRQIGKDVIVTAGYVGSKGTNLIGVIDINQVRPGAAAAAGLVPASGYVIAGTATARLNALRPYRGYTAVNTIQSWFNSNYHSLQVSAQKRFSSSSMMNLAYTWSRSLTDNGSDRSNAPQNTYNWKADYGLSPLDRRHVLVISYVYDVPFLKDRKDFVGKVLGGWQTSGIFSFNTGTPLTVTSGLGNDPGGLGILGPSAAGTRPDLTGVAKLSDKQTVERFFNTLAFAEVPVGTARPGNAGRGIVEGPRITRLDFSLFKQIPIKEALKVQFRAEAFNITNQVNFAGVSTSLGSATFGRVTSARDPRQVQLALKMVF